jgi:hypothetical protein
MRIQEARRIVNQAFHRSTFNDNGRVDLTQFKQRRVIKAVDKMLEWHTKQEAEYGFEVEMYYKECLSGEASSVINHLNYITDRWRCAGRLMFLRSVMELY